ncbi:hypothetical protein GQ43DRAFT_313965 [Delitschia confertaspora ATCC 74209]|uniref:Zn(2)-C6 fungal-type domain-containing protein n=1 Tax=Delitschia confertaspora ATCC 74209 TaxID=1513339 RepID=A0A9P4JNL1_9PLEO|nr:hypothetical protein GQ43DRAFT_313965 [Delitschia confertaspora ATCC 74209]
MRKPVSRACDACRRRKIKCNGLQPCPACSSASLICTFQEAQRKGGNQGARATVLNTIRDSQTGGPAQASTPFVSPGIIDACIEVYLRNLHQIVPFLNRELLEYEARQTDRSLESRIFITSFCAYVVTSGNAFKSFFLVADSDPEAKLGQILVDQTLCILPPHRASSPTIRSVFVSFFLYGAFAGLGNYRQGWFYLREATTLFMMCGKAPDNNLYSQEVSRRLFWVLLISERAHAVRRNRPITLHITPSSPRFDNVCDPPALKHLADIFRPFDDDFFAVWNGSVQGCRKEWLLDFETKVRTALPDSMQVSNEQAANLRISQFWLRIKLWELFPRFGFLSSASTHDCLTFRYPINVARDLLETNLPIESLQIHGVGMTEKVFDVACALSDILPFISTAPETFEGSLGYLRQLIALLAKLPYGSARFVPMLLTKVQELVPDRVSELCQNEQIPGPSNPSPLNITTRHMYEEEVGTLYSHLRRGYAS